MLWHILRLFDGVRMLLIVNWTASVREAGDDRYTNAGVHQAVIVELVVQRLE